ncbi:MAG: hypothetical protein II348_02780, partial [Clostridia bacterium]|nr:hypothetical protein [Clostridia bacterium]
MKEYRSNVGILSAEDLNLWYTQMSTKRQEQCDRYVDEKAKKLCIAADHLIRSALSEELKISTEQISLSISPDGKPYLEGNPLYFS